MPHDSRLYSPKRKTIQTFCSSKPKNLQTQTSRRTVLETRGDGSTVTFTYACLLCLLDHEQNCTEAEPTNYTTICGDVESYCGRHCLRRCCRRVVLRVSSHYIIRVYQHLLSIPTRARNHFIIYSH